MAAALEKAQAELAAKETQTSDSAAILQENEALKVPSRNGRAHARSVLTRACAP